MTMTKEQRWLIWSNEHQYWWRPASMGYTGKISQAGRYTFEMANSLCAEARLGLPTNAEPSEVMMLAPEFTKDFQHS